MLSYGQIRSTNKTSKRMKHPIRHLARITIEAVSPLAIGSGRSGFENERLVIRDANGLPFIPGTSLAGVLRHQMEADGLDRNTLYEIFGFHIENQGQGSRFIFSPGILLASDGKTVLDGLRQIDFTDDFFKAYQNLPERDHVRINDKGVAVDKGKFREQLVIRGTRFVFEVEFKDGGTEQKHFQKLLDLIQKPSFRIGAGTRNGFGELKVVELKKCTLNLKDPEELETYLKKSSSLDKQKEFPGESIKIEKGHQPIGQWTTYSIEISPENYFLFGSGEIELDKAIQQVDEKEDDPIGEETAETRSQWTDQNPKREAYFDWSSGQAVLKNDQKSDFIIPGTSIKGALAHRVAFYYNQLNGSTIENSGTAEIDDEELSFNIEEAIKSFQLNVEIDKMNYAPDSPEWDRWEKEIQGWSIEELESWEHYKEKITDLVDTEVNEKFLPVGENNPAVRALFGYAKDSEEESEQSGLRGKVIIPDLTIPKEKVEEKVFSHVAIDRFTGGAIDSALFEEKVIRTKESFPLDIMVETSALKNEKVRTAWEKALGDLLDGRLALGGNSTKGHGIFKGRIKNKS